jgi:type VI secretion system protein ImpG
VTIQFGAPQPEDWEYESHEHPLHRARTFFHFPYSELFLTAKGAKPPRNWQSFALCLDLDEAWPTNLRLSPHAFQLHVVPIENIKKDMANPIECDGTQERWPVRHPDTASRFVPHSVLGAYRMTDAGLLPLEPAVLGAKSNTFESIVEGRDEERRAWVVLDLPNAFDAPERVAVEAFWHQPGFADLGPTELRARLTDRYVDGVTWSCESPTVPHAPSALADDREGLLQLLSIKNQRFLGREELVFLLRALGCESEKYFAKLVGSLSSVTVKSKPFARRAGGFKYVYELSFDDLDGSDLPRLDVFGRRLLSLLTTWSVEEVVEITVVVPNLDKTFHYA